MISECLDCIVGATHVAVPIESVERLVEYQVGQPPPLSRSWVGGIGVLGPELFISVRLRVQRSARARRQVKGLLLRSPTGGTHFALEVDHILGIEDLIIDRDRAPALEAEDAPSGWLRAAFRAEGDTMAWLDIPAIEAALGGQAGASA